MTARLTACSDDISWWSQRLQSPIDTWWPAHRRQRPFCARFAHRQGVTNNEAEGRSDMRLTDRSQPLLHCRRYRMQSRTHAREAHRTTSIGSADMPCGPLSTIIGPSSYPSGEGKAGDENLEDTFGQQAISRTSRWVLYMRRAHVQHLSHRELCRKHTIHISRSCDVSS